jgi:hypothetical protein
MDRTLRAALIGALVCVGAAALAMGWSANYHVVQNPGADNLFVVNTLTGQRTFCGPQWCRTLPGS